VDPSFTVIRDIIAPLNQVSNETGSDGALVTIYPVVYHTTEVINWPGIQCYGLWSTTVILDRVGVTGEQRRRIESGRRPESVQLTDPQLGTFQIRDQKPMNAKMLERCLTDGMTPPEWLRLLNRKVFFWLDEPRLERLLAGEPYRGRDHIVIEVDTAQLVRRHRHVITLCHLNSGATWSVEHKRGPDTLKSISKYPYEERRRMRGWREAIAELAVDYEVPDCDGMGVR